MPSDGPQPPNASSGGADDQMAFPNGGSGAFRYPPADELSLADLWHALVRRKLVILACAVLATLLAVAFALLRPDSYAYTTSLQIGEQPPAESSSHQVATPLVNAGDVIAQLQNVYIPQAIRAERKAGGAGADSDLPIPDVAVTRAGKSQTIGLKTEGTAKHADYLEAILSRAAREVTKAEQPLYDHVSTRYETQLQNAKIDLNRLQNQTLFQIKLDRKQHEIDSAGRKRASLKDAAKVLHTRLDKLDTRKQLLSERIDRLQKAVQTASKQETQAGQSASDPTQAMSLMVLGNQVQSLRDHLDSTRETLQVKLPGTRESLQKQLADNARAQDNMQSRIARLKQELQGLHISHQQGIQEAQEAVNAAQARLASVSATRVLAAPSRSLKPTGIPGVVLVALGLILGLGGGIVLALLVDAIASSPEAAGESPSVSGETAMRPVVPEVEAPAHRAG